MKKQMFGCLIIVVLLILILPVTADPVCPVLQATQKCSDVQLTWTSYTDAQNYVLFRSTNNLNPPIIGSTPGLAFTDPNVPAGQYYYQILPVVNGGYVFPCGATSLPVTVTVSTCPVIPTPEFPTSILPVTMIIGILGTVFYIQRTREH